jgi:hypothetical protein
VLLETDDPKTANSDDPQALIEEARQLQRQRQTRRNVILTATALLVIVGLGVGRLAQGGGAVQASPPAAGTALPLTTVTYRKIELTKIVPHLPVEKRTIELWSSSAPPHFQRALVSIPGGPRFEVGTALRRDKLLGLLKVAYFYDASTNTIYQAGYLTTAPDPSPHLSVIPAPLGLESSDIPAPAGKQPTPRQFFNGLSRDPTWHIRGPRKYRGRSVYVAAHLASMSHTRQTFYFDAKTYEVVRNEIDTVDLRVVETTVARTTLTATKAYLALASLRAAHPDAHVSLDPSLRIRQLSGEAFYLSGQHDG